MTIISEGYAYTPTGILDDQVRVITPLPHVRRIRVYRKNLVKKMYEDGILKK